MAESFSILLSALSRVRRNCSSDHTRDWLRHLYTLETVLPKANSASLCSSLHYGFYGQWPNRLNQTPCEHVERSECAADCRLNTDFTQNLVHAFCRLRLGTDFCAAHAGHGGGCSSTTATAPTTTQATGRQRQQKAITARVGSSALPIDQAISSPCSSLSFLPHRQLWCLRSWRCRSCLTGSRTDRHRVILSMAICFGEWGGGGELQPVYRSVVPG